MNSSGLSLTADIAARASGDPQQDGSRLEQWFQIDPTPVLLVSAAGLVIAANSAARRMLDEGVAAGWRSKRLVFAQAHARRTFAAALENAASARGSRPIPVVLLGDDGRWRRFELMRSGEDVFVTVRCEPQELDIAPLVTAFRLSAAEGRILHHILEGESPKRIASQVGVSPNTVRAQLRSLYAKINVRGMTELTRECVRLTS